MIRRIAAIIKKEFRHILRDWQTLMIVLLMPIIMMFLYGYALTMDLKEIPVMIESPLMRVETRFVIDAIDASDIFAVQSIERVVADPVAAFKTDRVKALFRFPANFASEIRRGGGGAVVQVLLDGSDPNTGTILRNAVEGLLIRATLDAIGMKQPTVITVDQRVLYNPEQKSSLYFVPGLMAVILLMISALLTSLTITREKEHGTMEHLLVSPLHPGEIIIGKMLPYIVLSALDGALILVVGRVAFGVVVSGSLLFLAGSSLVYISTALAIGLLLSTIARTQQQAMLMVLPLTMLPTMVLSGFIFPLASMPLFLRIVSHIIPATYFLDIIRGIILKGVGIESLWRQLLALSAIGLLLLAVSVRKFRIKL